MDGYTADKDSVSDNANSNKTVIFNYTKKVTIEVVDQYDGKDNLRTTDLYEVGDEYSYEALSLEGYTANQSSYSGTANEDYTVVFKYTKNEVKEEHINITVIDAYDGVNHTRTVDSVKKGASYSYDDLGIEGYKSNTSNLTGVADKDITLVFEYTRNKAQYKVTVIDSYDDADHTRCVDTYTEGTSYSYNTLNLPGYTADKSTATGTVSSDLVVKFTYTKDAVPTYTVTVIDKYDGKSHTRTVDTFEKGATYGYYALDKNGYDATPKSYSGEVTKNIELVFEYSRTAHTITVIDRYDGKDHIRTTDTKQYGDSYSYSALNKTGYVVDVSSYNGTMGNKDKTLVFTYTKDKAKYTITVVDRYDGANHTRSEKVFTEGATYRYRALNKAGYKVDVPSYSGTVSKNITLTFTYTKESVPPVTYTVTVIDNYDGVNHTRLTEEKEKGSTYSYTALDKAGYTVDNKTLSGTVSKNITLTFTYTKESVPVTTYTIKVIDRYDGVDHTRLTETKKYGDSYSYNALEITGHTANNKTLSGTITSDKTVIFYYAVNDYTVKVYDYYDGEDHLRETETKKYGSDYIYFFDSDIGNPYHYKGNNYMAQEESFSGTVEEDTVIRFTYKRIYKITVSDCMNGVDDYRYFSNKELLGENYDPEADESVEYNALVEGSTYSYDCRHYSDYTCDVENYSGVVTSDLDLKFTYTPNSHTITVKDSVNGVETVRETYTLTPSNPDSGEICPMDEIDDLCIGHSINGGEIEFGGVLSFYLSNMTEDVTITYYYDIKLTIRILDDFNNDYGDTLENNRHGSHTYDRQSIVINTSSSGTINAYEAGNTYTAYTPYEDYDPTANKEDITLRDYTIADNASFSYSYDSDTGEFVFKKADGTEYDRVNPLVERGIVLTFNYEYVSPYSISVVQEIYDPDGVLLSSNTVYTYNLTTKDYLSAAWAYQDYGLSVDTPSCLVGKEYGKDYDEKVVLKRDDTTYDVGDLYFGDIWAYFSHSTTGAHAYIIQYRLIEPKDDDKYINYG